MRYFNRPTYVTLLVVLGLVTYPAIFRCVAQTMETDNNNIKWVSPDGSFSVISPVKLKKLKAPHKDESRTAFNSMEFYGGRQGENAYVVYVYDWIEKRKLLSFEDRIKGIEFILGGDDDKEFTSTVREINGFNAKEIIFSDQNIRGLIIDGNGKTYVLGLSAENRSELNSDATDRFFTSFRLLKNPN